MFKAVVFDIGHTMVDYKKPMNWSKLYRPAFEQIAEKYHYDFSELHYQNAGEVLAKYNTRINPRDREVSSAQIFTEILRGMDINLEDIEQVKESFYAYFRQDCSLFPDVEPTLKRLSGKGIKLATLSDVAYGMDNVYALADIESVIRYIDYPFTSNDIGYRKSSTKSLEILSEKMQINISEIVFAGDEEKDMVCAKNAGAYGVLINRDVRVKAMFIREMVLKDIEAVLPLYISYYNEQEDSCWNENTAAKRIHQVLSMEDSYGLIVENGDSVLGFAMGYFKQYDDIIGYTLDEIVISYECQKKGTGSMLLRELEQRVKEKGASCVELQAVNDDMHERYYGKAGYQNAKNFVLKVKWFQQVPVE